MPRPLFSFRVLKRLGSLSAFLRSLQPPGLQLFSIPLCLRASVVDFPKLYHYPKSRGDCAVCAEDVNLESLHWERVWLPEESCRLHTTESRCLQEVSLLSLAEASCRFRITPSFPTLKVTGRAATSGLPLSASLIRPWNRRTAANAGSTGSKSSREKRLSRNL